jgi:hypothetical protein
MALPVALPVAISAIKALVRFRDRIDTILSLNETTTGLPFALPPAPKHNAPFLKAMLTYCKTDQGKMALHLHGLEAAYEKVAADPYSISAAIDGPRNDLFELFYVASDTAATYLGPDDKPWVRGPSPDMRLAYFIVESQRLSKNPVLARVLLTAADTLLEFAGENASLFVSSPSTRAIVEDLIEEFAGKRDFDDEGLDVVFKSLLGSAIVAFAKNPPDVDGRPALKALFTALGNVRDSLGNDFVAKIISVEGFEKLISAYALESSKDPTFITTSPLLQKPLTAMLSRIGNDFPQMVDDSKAFLGVLEAGLGAASGDMVELIRREFDDQPALATVLALTMDRIGQEAQKSRLFDSLTKGTLIADLYRISLSAIAAAPLRFSGKSDVDQFISRLVSGLALTLSQKELTEAFSQDTLKALASQALTVLAQSPEVLVGYDKFATAVLSAVFKAGAQAIGDGVTKDDLTEIAAVIIKTSSENTALLGLDDRLCTIIACIGGALDAPLLCGLNTAKGRKDLLLACFQAVAANPVVWGQWEEKDLVQPLIEAVLDGLKKDPTTLLTGPVLVDSVRRILLATARRGSVILDKSITSDALKFLLAVSLERAGSQIGKTIDGENLPAFLERVVMSYLASPFALTGIPTPALEALFVKAVLEI